MSDPKSKASKTSEGKGRIPLGTRRLIGYGYLVVFVFFMLFFLFLAEARKVSPGLDTPRWSLLVAGILVLPLFLPAFKYVAPYIKSVKISVTVRVHLMVPIKGKTSTSAKRPCHRVVV